MDQSQRYRCSICDDEKYVREIIMLQCEHRYCLLCMSNYILDKINKNDININCPDCDDLIPDKVIRSVTSDEDIKKYDLKNLPSTYFHCLLQQCDNIVDHDTEDFVFTCENCTLFNCIHCKASHINMNCQQYKSEPKSETENICKKEMDRAQHVLSERQREALIDVSKNNLVRNPGVFKCPVCNICIGKGMGIRLRNCHHDICEPCLCKHINENQTIHPQCPLICKFPIEDREIKEILPKPEYECYERKSQNSIKPLLKNPFCCQTPDCGYFCEISDTKLKTMMCIKCKTANCVPCRAIHGKEKCKDYKLRMESTDIGKANKNIQEKINEGLYMRCTGCQAVIMGVHHCSWFKCSHCNMELCWAKKTSRWGPQGHGDTTGGCKCMVNGVLCDPNCGGCDPR